MAEALAKHGRVLKDYPVSEHVYAAEGIPQLKERSHRSNMPTSKRLRLVPPVNSSTASNYEDTSNAVGVTRFN